MKKFVMAVMLMPMMALANTAYGNEASDRDSTAGASAWPAKASSKKSSLKFSSDTKKLAKTPAKAKLGKSFSLSLGIVSSAGLTKVTAKGLPSGLSINKKTGKITGKPERTGTYTVKVTARDAAGRKVMQKVKISVSVPTRIKGTYYGYTYDYGGKSYALGNNSESVTITISSSGKISATVGARKFCSARLRFYNYYGNYSGLLHPDDNRNWSRGRVYHAEFLSFTIDPKSSFASNQLTGGISAQDCSADGLCTACCISDDPNDGDPQGVCARKNAAATNSRAKKIAAKCAKLGTQTMGVSVNDRFHDGDASYYLNCPNCVDGGLDTINAYYPEKVYIKTDTNGKATLSGSIAGTRVSGTTYLQYVKQSSSNWDVAHAYFFSGKFVIKIVYCGDGNPIDGSTYGDVWKRK